jgi:hypothetical protein
MYRFFVDYKVVRFNLPFTVQYYLEFQAGTTIQWHVLRFFVFVQLLGQITFTMTAAPGFVAVLTQAGRNGLLIDLEIQDDKALAEGLSQHAYQKHYRPPFIQVIKFQAKISG